MEESGQCHTLATLPLLGRTLSPSEVESGATCTLGCVVDERGHMYFQAVFVDERGHMYFQAVFVDERGHMYFQAVCR
jgi:hypothetical protein